ncbi:MAG TPA: NUDIX hydrolase N-terminal domain-containing protein [Bryobacteraceae bacterium]|nr:NUDIX hydrolase N-terminal domain-containing protein [Bryobacteraceae bacterium]
MEALELLSYAQRLQALAQAGLGYAVNSYDRERYHEIRGISACLLQELTDEPFEKIMRVFASEDGYQTPKVDVRAVIFRGAAEILLVSEKIDGGRWTLPGGWADVGLTPFEVAAKEVKEETGLLVEPLRLLALFDKRRHPHPPQPWYVYKAFIHCEIRGGSLVEDTPETSSPRWFTLPEIETLELSTDRITSSQLKTLFAFATNPALPALCD